MRISQVPSRVPVAPSPLLVGTSLELMSCSCDSCSSHHGSCSASSDSASSLVVVSKMLNPEPHGTSGLVSSASFGSNFRSIAANLPNVGPAVASPLTSTVNGPPLTGTSQSIGPFSQDPLATKLASL